MIMFFREKETGQMEKQLAFKWLLRFAFELKVERQKMFVFANKWSPTTYYYSFYEKAGTLRQMKILVCIKQLAAVQWERALSVSFMTAVCFWCELAKSSHQDPLIKFMLIKVLKVAPLKTVWNAGKTKQIPIKSFSPCLFRLRVKQALV